MHYPISVLITTFNEAQHIGDLLDQVNWAAERLVIDSFSTDETVAIAKAKGATVLERTYIGPAEQKNWGIQQVQYPWILILDADERLSPELTTEIQALVQAPITAQTPAGYHIHRLNFFMGQPLYYSGLKNDTVIRLIQGAHCHYNDSQVHEKIVSTGQLGRLKASMLHHTYKDLQHFLAKNERYARWSAQDHAHKTPKVGARHLFLKPLGRFFVQYVLKRGFLDGKAGFIFCVIMAWGVFLRYTYLREQQWQNTQEN